MNVKEKNHETLTTANPFQHAPYQISSDTPGSSLEKGLFKSVLPLPLKKDHDLIQQAGYQNPGRLAYLCRSAGSVSAFCGET